MLKKIVLSIVALLVMAPITQAVSIDTTYYHTIVPADSGRWTTAQFGYKDTLVIPTIFDISPYQRLFFHFHKHQGIAARDSNFTKDSVKIQLGFSYDAANWTWKTLVDSPQIPLFATADSFFNITTAAVTPWRLDSLNFGPLMKVRIIVKDTAETATTNFNGLKGNLYGRKYELHFQGK